jgi:hypothetical protein
MSKQKTFPHCMTLRISLPMESALQCLAFDQNLSKAAFIRRILRRAIVEAHQKDAATCHGDRLGGVL